LGGQVELYSRVVDTATLVVADRHRTVAMRILPPWWGVLRVEATRRGPRFRTLRRAAKNPARDRRALVELLWLDDALGLLERRQAARGVRGKPRRVIWDLVCEHYDADEIAGAVRTFLKTRAVRSDSPRPL
jgi:hypothetical protein